MQARSEAKVAFCNGNGINSFISFLLMKGSFYGILSNSAFFIDRRNATSALGSSLTFTCLGLYFLGRGILIYSISTTESNSFFPLPSLLTYFNIMSFGSDLSRLDPTLAGDLSKLEPTTTGVDLETESYSLNDEMESIMATFLMIIALPIGVLPIGVIAALVKATVDYLSPD